MRLGNGTSQPRNHSDIPRNRYWFVVEKGNREYHPRSLVLREWLSLDRQQSNVLVPFPFWILGHNGKLVGRSRLSPPPSEQ